MAATADVGNAAAALSGRKLVRGGRARLRAAIVLDESARAGGIDAARALCLAAAQARTGDGRALARAALEAAAVESGRVRALLLQLTEADDDEAGTAAEQALATLLTEEMPGEALMDWVRATAAPPPAVTEIALTQLRAQRTAGAQATAELLLRDDTPRAEIAARVAACPPECQGPVLPYLLTGGDDFRLGGALAALLAAGSGPALAMSLDLITGERGPRRGLAATLVCGLADDLQAEHAELIGERLTSVAGELDVRPELRALARLPAVFAALLLRWHGEPSEPLARCLMKDRERLPTQVLLGCRVLLDAARVAVELDAEGVDAALALPPTLATAADAVLRTLGQASARDQLCRLAARGDTRARNSALESGYMPTGAADRAIFLALTDRVCDVDDPGSELLAEFAALADRPGPDSSPAAEAARVVARQSPAWRAAWFECLDDDGAVGRLAVSTLGEVLAAGDGGRVLTELVTSARAVPSRAIEWCVRFALDGDAVAREPLRALVSQHRASVPAVTERLRGRDNGVDVLVAWLVDAVDDPARSALLGDLVDRGSFPALEILLSDLEADGHVRVRDAALLLARARSILRQGDVERIASRLASPPGLEESELRELIRLPAVRAALLLRWGAHPTQTLARCLMTDRERLPDDVALGCRVLVDGEGVAADLDADGVNATLALAPALVPEADAVLAALARTSARDHLCRLASRGDARARRVALEAGHIPSARVDRVVFLALTDRVGEVGKAGHDLITDLATRADRSGLDARPAAEALGLVARDSFGWREALFCRLDDADATGRMAGSTLGAVLASSDSGRMLAELVASARTVPARGVAWCVQSAIADDPGARAPLSALLPRHPACVPLVAEELVAGDHDNDALLGWLLDASDEPTRSALLEALLDRGSTRALDEVLSDLEDDRPARVRAAASSLAHAGPVLRPGDVQRIAPRIGALLELEEFVAALPALATGVGGEALADALLVAWAREPREPLARALLATRARISAEVRFECRLLLERSAFGDHAEPADLARLFAVRDPLRDAAESALLALQNASTREALCRLAIDGDRRSAALAHRAGYAPTTGRDQALFYVLTDRPDELQTVDPSGALLRSWYGGAGPAERRRIATALRRQHRSDLLASFIDASDGRGLARIGEVVPELVDAAAWTELLRLALLAAPEVSVRIVRELAESGWSPERAGDQELLARLTRLAARMEPQPPSAPPPVVLRRSTVRLAKGSMSALSFAADGHSLAVGSSRGDAGVWDLSAAETSWSVHWKRRVRAVSALADGHLAVALGGDDGEAVAVARHGHELWNRVIPAGVNTLARLREDEFLAGHDTGITSRWRIETRQPLDGLRVGRKAVQFVGTDGAGEWAVAGTDGVACFPVGAPGAVAAVSHHGVVRTAALSDAGLLVFSDIDGGLRALRRGHDGLRPESMRFRYSREAVVGLAFTDHDRHLLVVTPAALYILAWPSMDQVELHRTSLPYRSATLAPDRRLLALGRVDGSVEVWLVPSANASDMLREPLANASPNQLALAAALADLRDARGRWYGYCAAVLQERFRTAVALGDLQPVRAGNYDIEL